MAEGIRSAQLHLADLEFAQFFQHSLGWGLCRQVCPLTRGGVAKGIAIAGKWVVVEIEVDVWPDRPTRQRQIEGIRQTWPQSIVIWVDRPRQRSLWRLGNRERVLVRRQPIAWAAELQCLQASYVSSGDCGDCEAAPVSDWQALETCLEALRQGLGNSGSGSQRYHYAMKLLGRVTAGAALQQRGWLEADEWYLQNRFGQSLQRGGDRFFQEVLQPLWFQGLTLPPWERPQRLMAQLGEAPFLAPGLFQHCALDEVFSQTLIPDAAFEPLLGWLGDLANSPKGLRRSLIPCAEAWVNSRRGPPLTTPMAILRSLVSRLLEPLALNRVSGAISGQFATVVELLLHLSPAQAHQLLAALLSLTLLDPACGSGRYLIALLEALTDILTPLIGIAQRGTAPLPTPLTDDASGIALARHLINQVSFGVDISPEAVELGRLGLYLWLLEWVEDPNQLQQLPNPCLNILSGNALVGLLSVDSERFDQIVSRHSQAPVAFQGNLLQPLVAETYQAILRERQIRLEHYRSQTHLLAEADGVPGYVQAEFLSDRIDTLNQIAQTKLDQLLLHEFSVQLGVYYRQTLGAERRQRLLNVADIAALHPFHWGFHFHRQLSQQGGFDVIICHPPEGILQPSAAQAFHNDPAVFEAKGITLNAFRHNRQQLLALHPGLETLWQNHRSQIHCLNDFFRRTSDYAHATLSPLGQRHLRLYWERLYLERILRLLRPEGRAALVLPSTVWHQANGESLRQWLRQSAALEPVLEISNHHGALGKLSRTTTLSLLWLEKGQPTPEISLSAWVGKTAPRPGALEDVLQSAINLVEKGGEISRIIEN